MEAFAPPVYQEAYDNSGLLTGSPSQDVTGILVTLDCTEAVVDEAIERGCNLIVAHHPIIFKGLKKINGGHYVERAVIHAEADRASWLASEAARPTMPTTGVG